MRKSLLVIVAVMLPAVAALAEQARLQKREQAATSGKPVPLKGATPANSCSAYGAGFVRVEGSDTCMKIGGGVGIGGGVSAGSR